MPRRICRPRIMIAVAFLGVVVAAVEMLLRFPPDQFTYYPQCPVHRYLHVLCPGCGATRAMAALLRGHLSEAVHLNAFFVVILPFLAGYAALCCYQAIAAEEFRWPELPRGVVAVMLAAAAIFTVARNLV